MQKPPLDGGGFLGVRWDVGCYRNATSHNASHGPSQSPRCYTARLIPPTLQPRRKFNNKYSVEFDGELISCGRDAELDACRWLFARGYRGELRIIDGNTGRHRLTIDIERGAKLTVKEGPHGPYFCKWRPSDRAPTGEPAEEDV
jgi:hypothetical protein